MREEGRREGRGNEEGRREEWDYGWW